MKQFEIKKEEMDKWLDSKDLKKGFFNIEHDTSKQDYYSYSDDAEFNERIVADYYFWVKELKMGSLLDIPEDTSYFDYLLYNEYIEFKDSLTLATFEWSKGEERSDSFNDFDNDRGFIYNKYLSKSGDYPVREYSHLRKSEIMENFEKFWSYDWGYFNTEATLVEQEKFVNSIIMELNLRWLDEDDEDVFEVERYIDEDNYGITEMIKYVNEKKQAYKK